MSKAVWVIVIAIVAVLLIAGEIIFFYNQQSNITQSSTLLNLPSSQNSSTETSPQNPQTYHVVMRGFEFLPQNISIGVGDTVIWLNTDGVTHTVTGDYGSELSGIVPNGQTYSHTFNNSGNYSYHCSIHTYMHGNIVVR